MTVDIHSRIVPNILHKLGVNCLATDNYLLSRKNCCVPEMGLVTVFSPLTTTGAEELVVQNAAEPRFVVDCRVKPV